VKAYAKMAIVVKRPRVAGAMTKSKAKWQQPDFGTRCHFQNIFTDFFLTMKKNAPEVTYFV